MSAPAAGGALAAAVADRLSRWAEERVAERLWEKDGTLWAASGSPPESLAAWLGWLDLPEAMSERITELEHLARDVRADGYRRAAVLGMGGSSLAPEVFRRTFGVAEGSLDLSVLDSTDPDAIRARTAASDPARTLYIVSTKSGGTVETFSLFKYCYQLVSRADFPEPPGSRFIAITDPGSGLVATAEKYGFREIFFNDPEIGGRYSALSLFGLVPAALLGVDLDLLIANAETAGGLRFDQQFVAWGYPAWARLVVGAAYKVPLPSGNGDDAMSRLDLQLAADVHSPWDGLGQSEMRVGLDVGYERLVRLRGGYAFVPDGLSGPSVGVGVTSESIGVDLARMFVTGSDLIVPNPTFFSFRIVF